MIHTPEFEPWNAHMVFELIDYDSKIRSRIQEIPSGWMVHVQTELWLMWRLRFEIAQAQPDTLPSQVFVRMIWKLMFGDISDISWELFRDWALRSGQNNKKQSRVLKIVAFEAGCAQLEITCLVAILKILKTGDNNLYLNVRTFRSSFCPARQSTIYRQAFLPRSGSWATVNKSCKIAIPWNTMGSNEWVPQAWSNMKEQFGFAPFVCYISVCFVLYCSMLFDCARWCDVLLRIHLMGLFDFGLILTTWHLNASIIIYRRGMQDSAGSTLCKGPTILRLLKDSHYHNPVYRILYIIRSSNTLGT